MFGILRWFAFLFVLCLAIPSNAQEFGRVFGMNCEGGVCQVQQGPVFQALTQPIRTTTQIASGTLRRAGTVVSGVPRVLSKCGPNGCQPVRRTRFIFR